jgi:hypothetical protein
MRENDFINLNRHFIRVPKNSADEARQQELEIFAYKSRDYGELGWDTILEKDRVVILGEPGSGKTSEFKHQSLRLSASGKEAFFIDLRELVDHRLIDILDRKSQLKQFQSWLRSDKPGWFFLDAVDESRLAHQKDFQKALENFSRDIAFNIRKRAHILLSSRISSWRQQTDLMLFESLLAIQESVSNEMEKSYEQATPYEEIDSVEPYFSKESKKFHERENRTYVVKIAPLHLDQIETFVDQRGENGKEFREALVAQFLEPLSRRPLDVENLVRYWRDNNGFGSYIEMLEHSVTHGLKEPSASVKRNILSPEKTRQGAEILAAMVLFCRRRDIALPGTSSEALIPREALPTQWTDSEVESLLDRGLFDAPLFGQIRFHLRETEEYLTACWLQYLVEINLPIHVLRQLLFEELPNGLLVLRPAIAPVAAWMACFNYEETKQIRSWLRKTEPELFFRAGDPSQLPLEYRKLILASIIESFQGRKFTRIDIDIPALTRFAKPELAEYLASKCIDKSITEDLRSKFFHMAILSKMSGLEASALSILLDSDETNYLKDDACDYIAAMNDLASLKILSESLLDLETPSISLVESLLEALFPKFISKDEAIYLIKRLDGIDEFSTGLRFSLTRHCNEKYAPEDVIKLIDVINDLLCDGPPWHREANEKYKVGSRFIGLGDVLLVILPLTFDNIELTAEQISIIAKAIWLIVYLSQTGKIHNLDRVDLASILKPHEHIRREYLKYSLEIYQHVNGNLKQAGWFFISSNTPNILSMNDAEWILDEAGGVQVEKTRCLLQIVEDLWVGAGYPTNIRHRARRLIRNKRFDGVEHFPSFPGYFTRHWYTWQGKYRRTLGSRYWWSGRRRSINAKIAWWQNQWSLFRLLPKIRQGKHKRALWFLINELNENSSSQLTRIGWSELRKSRGRLIEAAARKGTISYWPRFTPTLRHERPTGDRSIDGGVIIGLTGIQEALNAKQLDFASVSDEEARQLTRYALNEINGLPNWFKELAVSQPVAVHDVLLSSINYEWQIGSEHEHVHEVLASLSSDRTGVYVLMLETILKKLVTADPVHSAVLSQALSLIFRRLDSYADTLCDLAKKRVLEYEFEAPQHIGWMNILLQLDASSALAALEDVLNKAAKPKDYMVRLTSVLSTDGRFNEPILTKPSYMKPEYAYRFIRLFFIHLPPEDDKRCTPGKVYRVTNLEEAVRFRDGLIARLAEIDDDDTEQTLKSLLDEAVLTPAHDWIHHLILQHRRQRADMEPWTANRVRTFQEQHETAPRNPRELFHFICNRLQTIKDWVETGEDSPRSELQPNNIEKDVRIWVARKLVERSKSRYIVPQEHEIANGKRQDIRIEAANIPGPVVVEVKQKEGASYNELKERLENQLIGDYLKAPNAQYGIFLVSYTGHNKLGSGGKDQPSGRPLAFADIIQNLQELANTLVNKNPGVEQVRVFGIDFVST